MIDKSPYDRRTVSGVIHRNKCLLLGVLLEPDGTNASYVDIFDGENTTEPKMARIRTEATTGDPKFFYPPVFLERGLFVDLGANLTAVTVFSKSVE